MLCGQPSPIATLTFVIISYLTSFIRKAIETTKFMLTARSERSNGVPLQHRLTHYGTLYLPKLHPRMHGVER